MSTTHAFLDGLAQMLDDADVGVYDPAHLWTNAEPTDTPYAVSLGPQIPEDPPRVIVLSGYGPAPDDPKSTDSLIAVQFRIRGTEDPQSVMDVHDALFNLLNGMHDTTVGGVPLVMLWQQSWMSGDPDENRRQQMSSNWYARITQASTYRTD